MPDIQMCASDICRRRATCRRNQASGTVPHDLWQAWGDYRAYEHGDCPDYWEWPPQRETAG